MKDSYECFSSYPQLCATAKENSLTFELGNWINLDDLSHNPVIRLDSYVATAPTTLLLFKNKQNIPTIL